MSLLFTPYVEFFIESLTSRRNADRFWVNLQTGWGWVGEDSAGKWLQEAEPGTGGC